MTIVAYSSFPFRSIVNGALGIPSGFRTYVIINMVLYIFAHQPFKNILIRVLIILPNEVVFVHLFWNSCLLIQLEGTSI